MSPSVTAPVQVSGTSTRLFGGERQCSRARAQPCGHDGRGEIGVCGSRRRSPYASRTGCRVEQRGRALRCSQTTPSWFRRGCRSESALLKLGGLRVRLSHGTDTTPLRRGCGTVSRPLETLFTTEQRSHRLSRDNGRVSITNPVQEVPRQNRGVQPRDMRSVSLPSLGHCPHCESLAIHAVPNTITVGMARTWYQCDRCHAVWPAFETPHEPASDSLSR